MDVDEMIKLKLVHEIHTSERRSFRACRRRWDWLFRQSYYPVTTAKPLEFGSAFHVGMEVYYNPETWRLDREVIGSKAILAFVDECEKQKNKALENNTSMQFMDEDVMTDYQERVDLGRGMLYYYFTQVAPVLDKGWKPVKVEIAFMLPIPNPETGEDTIWCKCDLCLDRITVWWREHGEKGTLREVQEKGLPVVYAGRLDMLAEDGNGNYWIFDWKTARAIATDTEFLYLDDQIGSYVWALRKLGLPIRGFVYHEQRKGYPRPPKENTTVRLGCKFSVAKNQDVDYATYLAHVKEFDTKAYEEGKYAAMLTYLENDATAYYARHQIAKSEADIKSIEYNIGLEALDMIEPGLRIYPSAGRFGCNFCAFRQPCMEKNDGSDYQYALDTMFEKREHYYVRAEPSTESKGGE